MKHIYFFIVLMLNIHPIFSQEEFKDPQRQEEINKEIARSFYEDLWFNNRTENYHKYVADEYTVHDIGDRKGVKEPAIEQKNIADFFWKHGEMKCQLDFQIAEGDLVASRWTAVDFEPSSLFGRLFLKPKESFSIINVFRIQDGKIVEFWNHRHDIDTPQTLKYTFRGFLIGLLFCLIPLFFLIRVLKKTN